MKKLHKIIAASLLASATTGVALAESPLTANIAVGSNYIWRGETQSNDTSAVSGGIDYANASGFYAGVWVSNTSGGNYEQDLYLGFSGEAGPVSYDVSYTAYQYPVVTGGDFAEIGVSVGYEAFTFGLASTISSDDDTTATFSDGDMYMSIGAEFEVKKDLTLGLTYGDYDFDDATATDYSHIQVSLSKGDFTFAIDDTDKTGAAGEIRTSVSWSKSFDL